MTGPTYGIRLVGLIILKNEHGDRTEICGTMAHRIFTWPKIIFIN